MLSVRLAAVTVRLPLLVSIVAVPPVRPPSAVASSASVETWPTPVPKVMVSVGLTGAAGAGGLTSMVRV